MFRYLIDADCAVYAMDVGHEALKRRLSQCAPGEVAIPLLAFDEHAARAYAKLPEKRARFDRLLAAHALSIGATVVTNNKADFADVPGLKVENWAVE